MSFVKATFLALVMSVLAVSSDRAQPQPFRFHLQEATIADVHRAIQEGQISCRALVQAYIRRARAYNGTCNQLVTEDMAPKFLPNYSEYKTAVTATASLPPSDPRKTPPIEFGRMEATASDPTVQQQFGMTVGIPNAGQVRALGMLNIRGERSVTCKGEFDKSPASGPLPAGAPKVCEEFRRQPDALERAAELDAQYGRNPDLAQMPMYCIPFSFKDAYDTKDMRSTGGADARYDMDFPPRDHTLVAQLRQKGAIIYAKANTTEYNGRGPGDPGGRNFPTQILPSTLGYQRSTWAGNPCESYDTTRAASIGSSSGSGVSVSTNLVLCSLCEETGQSCRGPANHNSVALILPHKALLSFLGGAIGTEIYNDRAGIHCRNIVDAAKVLDALKDSVNGYYDPRDIFTTVPRSSVSAEPYSRAVVSGSAGALKGMRIGIIREFMITPAKADEPIVEAVANEMKQMLGKHLGATLVEAVTPGGGDGGGSRTFRFTIAQYLARRAKDWADRGYTETLVDWPTLNARSKFWGDDQRANFKNWEEIQDLYSPPKGIAENIQRRELLNRVLMKVIQDNKLDLLIQLHTALPPGKIGLAAEPNANNRLISYPLGPNAGITEILIPAGYVRIAYDPTLELATDANGRKVYRAKTSTIPTELPPPGLPFSINFLVEPGMEHLALKAASAYQAASQRRVPPPAFEIGRAS